MAALKHDRNGAYWDRYASDLVFRGSVGAQCYWLACVAHATDKHCPFHELDAEEFMGTIGVDWTLSRGGRWGAWLMHNPVREYRNDPLYTDAMCRWALIEICFEQCVDARWLQSTMENLLEISPELEADIRSEATDRYRFLVRHETGSAVRKS